MNLIAEIPSASIERIPVPTAEVFLREYVRPARPVVITGAAEQWPARRLWSLDYFRNRFGDRMVQPARVDGGRLYRSPKSGFDYSSQRLADFIDGLSGPGPSRYLMALFHECFEELEADVRPPSFAPTAPWSIRKLWMSPADSRTPLHMDLPENLFVQIIGRKRVNLYPPSWGREMYRFPIYSRLPQVSQVDSYEPDYGRFPRFRRARGLSVVVEPGEMLFIPRRWWHHLRALDTSISVNHWWATGPVYWAIRGALTYQKLRAIRF